MTPRLVEQAITEMRDRMLRPQLNAFLELVYEQAGDPLINIERVTDNRYYIAEGVDGEDHVRIIGPSGEIVLVRQGRRLRRRADR